MKLLSNLTATENAKLQLNGYEEFCSRDLVMSANTIVFLQWVLYDGGVTKDGDVVIERGPHYACGLTTVDQTIIMPNIYVFDLEGRILCASLSKDLEFSEHEMYILDYNKEFIIYPAKFTKKLNMNLIRNSRS